MYTCISAIETKQSIQLRFKRQGVLGRLADACMYPLTRAFTARDEATQRTHFWNNQKFGAEIADELRNSMTLFCPGLPDQIRRKHAFDVRFHLPRFGGWELYVVLMPVDESVRTWYPGWLHANGGGISMVPVSGPVRLLIGPDGVHFFGVDEVATKLRSARLAMEK
jgi:hypothetical protein